MLVVLSATSYGCVGPLGKLALAHGASVSTILALRYAVGALALALLLMAFRRAALPPLTAWPALAALGLLLVVTSGTYFVSLRTLDAGVASVLLFTNPVLVAIAARPLFGEHLGRRGVAALVLAVAGVALVADPGRVHLGGAAWALAAAVAYTCYILGSRRFAAPVDPLPASALIMGASAIGFAVVGGVGGSLGMPDEIALLAILGLGLVGGTVAVTAFQMGLPGTGAGRAAILSTLEPATTVVVGALALGERLGPGQLVGALAIGGAAVLVATRA